MFTEARITEIYCIADDFCKKFASLQAKFMLEDKKTKCRNKPSRMNDAGIMVILILFHSGGFRRFKHYCIGYVCKCLRSLFPHAVSYNRFVESEEEPCVETYRAGCRADGDRQPGIGASPCIR